MTATAEKRFLKFIEDANNFHNYKYDYSLSVYINAKTYIKITCPDHGVFEQSPTKHLVGGCRKCGIEKQSKSNKLTKEKFIKKANKIHNNLYDYSLVAFKHKNTKVKIICDVHGQFQQTPVGHLQGYGCKKCAFKVLTNEDFIKKANKIHNFSYEYSLVNIINSKTKIKIICKKHGEFYQKLHDHLAGYGCKKCGDKVPSNEQFILKFNQVHNNCYTYNNFNYINNKQKIKIICKYHGEFTKSITSHLNGSSCKKCLEQKNKINFINKASLIHKNKYNYSKIIYKNTRSKIEIICYNHDSFWKTANEHLRGVGCQKCSQENRSLTLGKFIEKSNLIHKNKYDYKFTKYSKNTCIVDIICKNHGIFKQQASHHLNGSGCALCAHDARRSSTYDFIEKAKVIHKEQYDYSLVNYKSAKIYVSIICKDHGIFYQSPNNHLSGGGCDKCGGSYNYTTDEFIKIAKKIHGEKYNYDKSVYIKMHEKLIVICKKHGEFLQTPSSHIWGRHGCSKCAGNSSKVENQWLDIYSIPIQNRQFPIKTTDARYSVDGFDPETNTIYEFLGDYWHGNPDKFSPNDINIISKKTYGQLYEETFIKINALKNAGFNVVYIWQNDFVNNLKESK